MKVKHLTGLVIIVFLSSLPLQGCTTVQPGEVGIKSTRGMTTIPRIEGHKAESYI